jgi:thymidylate synthase (FAD)
MIDPYLKVDLISKTPNPQKIAYADAHQCYSENYVADEFFGEAPTTDLLGGWVNKYVYSDPTWIDPFNREEELTEKEAGERVIKHCLNHKHFGVIESPQITFAVGYFPHTVLQQARTHRISVTFNVQSFRYTGQRILDVVDGKRTIEEVFYTRPIGHYDDRKGVKYEYTEEARKNDLIDFYACALKYARKIEEGYSEEHARDICIPYAIRQHFTVSFNIRSLFHFLDMRTPLDAQLEIRQMCDLMWPHVEQWIPELAAFYYAKRWSKNNLAP